MWVENDEARNLRLDGAASSPPASIEYAVKGLLVPLVGKPDNDLVVVLLIRCSSLNLCQTKMICKICLMIRPLPVKWGIETG